jgi:hypothetical protein
VGLDRCQLASDGDIDNYSFVPFRFTSPIGWMLFTEATDCNAWDLNDFADVRRKSQPSYVRTLLLRVFTIFQSSFLPRRLPDNPHLPDFTHPRQKPDPIAPSEDSQRVRWRTNRTGHIQRNRRKQERISLQLGAFLAQCLQIPQLSDVRSEQ